MAKLCPQFVLFGDSSITQLSFENGGWRAAPAALYARQVLFISPFYLNSFFSFASYGLGCKKLERRKSIEVVLVVFVEIVVSVFFFTVAL
jgi:hypothetical protein